MKKLWLATFLVVFMITAMAQRPGTRRPVNKTSTTENQAKSANQAQTIDTEQKQKPANFQEDIKTSEPANNNTLSTPVIQNARDNINIVHKNGQAATPIGHQAHAINGGYAALGRKNPWNVDAPIAQPVTNATVTPGMLNHSARDIFKWNGQTSTRYGHEAASVNGYAALGKKNPWVPEVNPMIIPVDPEQALKGVDNREIIKLNGQKATKTGHEATAVGSGYASLKTRKE